MQAECKDNQDESENRIAEENFCWFYVNILNKYYEMDDLNIHSGIYQSLKNIRNNKNRLSQRKTVSFVNKYDRAAYVFAYSVIHSVVIYKEFSQVLRKNPSILQAVITRKEIKLCILGGGPAPEAVAIYRILNKILRDTRLTTHPSSCKLSVTVIDECNGWKNDARFFMMLAQHKSRKNKFVKVHFSFIRADLTKDFPEEVVDAIQTSHFVTMVKFISDVNSRYAFYPITDVTGLIQNVLENMSLEACLFYLDTAGGNTFKEMNNLIDGHQNTERIYGPNAHQKYILNYDTVNYHTGILSLMDENNVECVCTRKVTISCSAWLKVPFTSKPYKPFLIKSHYSKAGNKNMNAVSRAALKKCKIFKIIDYIKFIQ